MIDPLNHSCRAKEHCVARTSDGPAITAKSHTLCAGCCKRLQEHLRQLPHLQDALGSFKAGSLTGTHGSKVNATPTPSTPLNLSVVDLITEIWRVISIAGGPTIRISNLITEPAEDFVVWRGGRRRPRPLDGADRALAIGEVWRKADGIVGLSKQWTRRHAPCLRCGQRTLGNFVGDGTIHCMNSACGKSYTLDDYDGLCLAKAALEKIDKKREKSNK